MFNAAEFRALTFLVDDLDYTFLGYERDETVLRRTSHGTLEFDHNGRTFLAEVRVFDVTDAEEEK